MLDAGIVKITAAGRCGEARRAVALTGHDRRGAGGRDLLVRETHPHGSLWIDLSREGQVVLIGHLARQTDLSKLCANGSERKQAIKGEIRGRDGEATELITAQKPVDHIVNDVQRVAAERE